ncbi:MAG: hypothetical protein MUP58_03505 [Candidatus Nanohaloarchaeota archaeon QJJ-9]|nr:hypothetical protein [Candidatus Nanohaloarchaeota archaeon QJJ-9]
MEEDENLPEEVYKIAEFRLDSMPSDMEVSIGLEGSYNKQEIKEHLEKRDKIGKTFAKLQLEGLRAFKEV